MRDRSNAQVLIAPNLKSVSVSAHVFSKYARTCLHQDGPCPFKEAFPDKSSDRIGFESPLQKAISFTSSTDAALSRSDGCDSSSSIIGRCVTVRRARRAAPRP